MASQAAWIEQEMGEGLAYLDINMGCPARKIVSKGDGSALMKEPALAASIVRAVKSGRGASGHGEVPPGLGGRRRDGARLSRAAWRRPGPTGSRCTGGSPSSCTGGVPTGASSLACARRCPCPSWATATSAAAPTPWRVAAETGCDAVMIARGAEGNPWLFSQVQGRACRASPSLHRPRLGERIAMARRHARAAHPSRGAATSCACASTPCGTWRACPAPPLPAGASTTARPLADFDARVRRASGDCPGAFVICPSRANIAPISCCPSRIRVVRPTLGGIAIRSDSPRRYRRRQGSVFPHIAAPSTPSAELARLQCLLASDYPAGKRGLSWLTTLIRHCTCIFRSA